MNLAFSEDEEAIREEFRHILASSSARSGLEAIERHQAVCDRTLWQRLADTGWLAAAISEAHGGSDLGAVAVCILAEEHGRAVSATPFTASACGFAVGLGLSLHEEAQARWLPKIADGSATGLVLQRHDWAQAPQLDTSPDGRITLSGATAQIRDGAAASVALALVEGPHEPTLVLLPLPPAEDTPAVEHMLDPLHPSARFQFRDAPVVVLAAGADAADVWQQLRNRQALYNAFEQLGGAQAALQMARDYSLSRYAFGRAIGSFQALKHSMADMLAAMELARANCCYGAAALSADEGTLAEAAAVAQISASEAYALCARQNMQIHGGIGVTWESDAHLHYRRAQSLATALGTPASWKEHLIELLWQRHGDARSQRKGVSA